MEKSQFKYDVAISFLSNDEPLALNFFNNLKDKTSVFFYSEKQKEIAGKDGEVIFNQVFGEESRVVIVLYREGWGSTSWTRIEETAIRNRAMNEGYDFVLFIPLDQPPTVPKYLPKTYIWYGINRYGFEVALSIIESKIQAEGGKIKIEGPEDVAKRIKETELYNHKRISFLQSIEGVKSANLEVIRLYELLKKKKELLELDGFPIGYNNKNNYCIVTSHDYALRFDWSYQYNNSLEYSSLHISLVRPKRYDSPDIIKGYNFNFDLLPSDQNVWIFESNKNKYYTSEQLVDFTFNILLKHIENENETKRSRKYL